MVCLVEGLRVGGMGYCGEAGAEGEEEGRQGSSIEARAVE